MEQDSVRINCAKVEHTVFNIPRCAIRERKGVRKMEQDSVRINCAKVEHTVFTIP